MTASDSSNRLTLWSVGKPNASYSGSCQPAAEAEDEPAAADVVEGGRHLGQQRRIAKPRAHDERPELHPAGRLGDRRQDRPALVDARLLAVGAEEQVVEDPDRIEPGLLGRDARSPAGSRTG